jgi:hypothetical protein
MKKLMLTVVAVILGIMLMAPAANAIPFGVGDNITIATSGWRTGSGGEFALYYPAVGQPSSGIDFYTFCIETDETIGIPETVRVGGIGTKIVYNGGTTPTMLDLTPKAAFLFKQFSGHTAAIIGAGYSYDQGAGETLSGFYLQEAIWYFQYGRAITTATNPFIGFANTANPQGTDDVVVLNLYHLDGRNAQDMLALQTGIITPEPMTLMLLGLGLVGIGVVRRKK